VSDAEDKPEVASSSRAEQRGAADEAAAPRSLAPRMVFGAFVLAGLGVLGVYLALRPDGDPVGDVDLMDPSSTVIIDGTPGDDVTFVSRVTTGLGAYDGSSWKSRSNGATQAMKASTLTVVVVGPDGAEQTSRCALWGGSMSSDRPDDAHLTENGVINDCAISLGSIGKHTVRASVQWDSTLAVTEARLTVYREAGAP